MTQTKTVTLSLGDFGAIAFALLGALDACGSTPPLLVSADRACPPSLERVLIGQQELGMNWACVKNACLSGQEYVNTIHVGSGSDVWNPVCAPKCANGRRAKSFSAGGKALDMSALTRETCNASAPFVAESIPQPSAMSAPVAAPTAAATPAPSPRVATTNPDDDDEDRPIALRRCQYPGMMDCAVAKTPAACDELERTSSESNSPDPDGGAAVACRKLVARQRPKLDDMAWQQAAQVSPNCAAPSHSNDCKGYDDYLTVRPRGMHSNEARALLAQSRPMLVARAREEQARQEAEEREAARTVLPRCINGCLVQAYKSGSTANRDQCEAACKECIASGRCR
jgi:hypothetical protein